MAYNPVPKLTNSNALFGNDLNVSGVSTFDAGIKTPLKDGVDGATITFDMDESNNHSVTLGGNRTLAVSNVDTGQKFTIRLKQDGTGSRTVNWWSGITWFTSTGVPPTLKEDPNTVDYIGFVCTSGGYYDGFHLTESAGGGGGGGGTPYDDTYVSGVATFASGLAVQNEIDIITVSGLTGGGTADLQTVTDNGATTTNAITINNTLEAETVLADIDGPIIIECKNTTGSQINAGTPVYVSGYFSTNGKALIAPAVGNDPAKMPSIGLVADDLAHDTEGHVHVFGIARGFDTSSFTVGETTYVAPTGGLTNARPSGVDELVQNMGRVLRSDATQGRVLLLGPGRTNDVPNSGTFQILDVETGNFENINLTSDDQIPLFTFTGSGTTDTPIRMKVLSSYASASTSGTALAFEGTQGQLFGITDNLSSGTIFSVNDITGLPLIAVNASGDVEFAKFGRDIIAHKPILISGGVPSNTTNKLYNDNGTLMFNGSTIGTGGGGGGATYAAGSGITIDGGNNINVYGGSGNFEYVELTTDNNAVPVFKFLGSGATDTPINLEVRSSLQSATGSGTALLFQGTQGQLFSITDNLSSGTIFNVSDITGLPMLEVTASGDVEIGEFADNITIHQPVLLSGGIPSSTTNKLYNNNGSLYFNGSAVGGSSYTAGTGLTLVGTQFNTAGTGLFERLIFDSGVVRIGEWSVAMDKPFAERGISIGYEAGWSSDVVNNTTYDTGHDIYIGGKAGMFSNCWSLDLGFASFKTRNNVLIGYKSGYNSTDIASNVCVGDGTFEGASGMNNLALGSQSLNYSLGNNNVAVGQSSLRECSGINNVAIGFNSLRNIDGNYNIEIVTNGSSTSVIGNNDNKLHIENTIIGDTSSKLLAIGNVGTGNLTPDATLEILPKLATDVGVIVQGAATQTANLQEWQDSSESVLAHIKSDGSLVTSSGNFSGNVAISGSLTAATKSFLIDHPSKEGMHLQYASLEGPENGVYVRGTTDEGFITLPDYWRDLVHNSSITVTLTPVGQFQPLFVEQKSNREIRVGGVCGYYDYVVYGERKDVDKLEVEW